MSKSRGNVIDPNEVVDVYGADVLRTYVLFMGDYEQAAPWSESSVKGCKRFIDRLWKLQDMTVDGDAYSDALSSAMHKTIKKVTEDIEAMKFNTAIAAVMTLLNQIYDNGTINRAELRDLLLIINPFAPHVTEEMWENMGFGGMLNEAAWPEFDEAKTVDNTVEIAIQIMGKVRSRITVPTDISAEEAIALAKQDERIAAEIAGKQIKKEIYVPGKLVNIVAV
jgi:leucyl-tRNA synthetase